jgi:hypothetical protein
MENGAVSSHAHAVFITMRSPISALSVGKQLAVRIGCDSAAPTAVFG